jgi:cell division protein YceG involved in septum cleavage
VADGGRTSRDRYEALRERQRRRAQRDGGGDAGGQPETPLPPPDAPLPPTDTALPPTDTALPPTDTALPPTDTALPPTDPSPPPHRYPRSAGGARRASRVSSDRPRGRTRVLAVLALLLAVAVVVVVVVALVPSSSNAPAHHVVRLKTTNVTIIPGRTRRQLDALLRSQGVKGSYFNDTVSSPQLNPHSFGAPARTRSLEGFLFPDTYNLREPLSIPALVADQLQNFKQKWAKVNLSYARLHHLTPYDVLIIASMVEAEGATPHDMNLVASVIYNRLRDGMPLQIDATTRYATGNYTRPLTEKELKSPSPYNTRTHTGLTPTPIDSPGLQSIQAAAHPPQSDYLYFVVKPCGNGTMVFSSNYQQFLADTAQYQAARSKLGRSPTHC